MATTTYFERKVRDQGNKDALNIEIGRSSFYSGVPMKDKEGVASIYLKVDDRLVVMDEETAKEFVESVASVGRYFGYLD